MRRHACLLVILFVCLLTGVPRAEAQVTQELSYDDGSVDFGNSGITGWYNAVRFSLPAGWSGCDLLTARFYIYSNPSQFRFHVFASDKATHLASPFTTTPTTSPAWFNIDLTSLGIIATGDFYLAIEYLTASVGLPYIGGDTSVPFDARSWCYYPPGAPVPQTGWILASADYMIRAVVRRRAIPSSQVQTSEWFEDFSSPIDDWAITTSAGGSFTTSTGQYVSAPSCLYIVSPYSSSVACGRSRSLYTDLTKDYVISLYFKWPDPNVDWILVAYNRHVWLVATSGKLYWWTPGGAGGTGVVMDLSANTWYFIEAFVHPDLGKYKVCVNNVYKAWANFAYSSADSYLTIGDSSNSVGFCRAGVFFDDIQVHGYRVDVEWIDYFDDGTLTDVMNCWDTSAAGSGSPVFEVTSAEYRSPPYSLHVRSSPLIPGASSYAFGHTHKIMLDYKRDYIIEFSFKLPGTTNNGIYVTNNRHVTLGVDGVNLNWYDVVGGHNVMALSTGTWHYIECMVHPSQSQYDIHVNGAYKTTANFGFSESSEDLLLGDDELGPSVYGEGFWDSLCVSGYSLLYSRVLSALSGKAYIINPDRMGSKHPGVGYAYPTDWVAGGVFLGMMRYVPQNLGMDSDDVWCSLSNGQPKTSIIPSGSAIVMFGGPDVGSGVHYYEQHGTGADQAPVYCEVTGPYWHFKRSGTGATLSSMAVSDVNGGHRDQAIIEIFRDANDRPILIVYGFGYKGTTAVSLFIKFHMWPAYIGILNHKYIIIQWEDDGDGIVQGPGVDSYWVVAAG